jgi:anti-anti-sigma factor
MEQNIRMIGEAVIITLTGRIDANTSPDIEQRMLSLVSEGSNKLVADLSRVTFISSAGLKTLLIVLKKTKREQGDLRLSGIQAQVNEVFDITGLIDIFSIHDSAENAAHIFDS